MNKKHHTVVCAIIVNEADQVLVALRAPHQDYGGFWEFPGGKCEPGEALQDALTRELREELAIEVQAAEPWMIIDHEYELYFVTLHIWRVLRYEGEPSGCEGQWVQWMNREALKTLQFPEANQPIVEALSVTLPPLHNSSSPPDNNSTEN